METVSSTGFMDTLIKEVTGDDLLSRLAAIQVMITLTETKNGVAVLQKQKILDKLGHLMMEAQTDPMGDALVPGIFP